MRNENQEKPASALQNRAAFHVGKRLCNSRMGCRVLPQSYMGDIHPVGCSTKRDVGRADKTLSEVFTSGTLTLNQGHNSGSIPPSSWQH
jgi:hypothetical protein